MVSHNCVEEFGYKGYNSPPTKKKKEYEDDEMSPIELLATAAETLLFDNCLVTQNTVKEESTVDDSPLKPVTLFKDITYQGGSLITSSVINGQVENESFSNVVVSLGSNSSRDDVNLISSRDDDENFSGCIHPQVTKNSPRFVPRSGDRRFRKIVASRHYKGGSRHDSKPWRSDYLQRSYPIKQRGSNTVSSKKGRVRLRIKSFKVPELLVEISENATVGSLKRMVMEAVSTLLSDGYQVGLMVHGKKVREDNKTLHQTGISQDDKTHLDSLDFSFEPTSSESPQLLASYTAGHACEEPLGTKNTTHDSKAMVSELSPRPLCRKSKRREQQQMAAQRRTRRPFSVGEVEALVEAVEKIGTGRWRDVKLCAFEDSDRRTYVDLKDKWKTLVHTAKITPHQRRGEPVPQELLDRVLNAHVYWSQQQNVSKDKEQQKQEIVVSETEALLLLV